MKDSSKQKTKEIRFSLEAVETKKDSRVREINNRNPDADRVPPTQENEPSDPSVLTRMIPCSQHADKDEPNSFHF